MNNFVKDVLNVLSIQPYKKFFIVNRDNHADKEIYYFDSELELRTARKHTICDKYSLIDIIRGRYKIVKVPIHDITEKEQLAIDYAKACGHKWLVKNRCGSIVAYRSEPQKNKIAGYWENGGWIGMEIKIPISFLSWYDEEPYYIGD